jgi:hypothetical protein
MNIINVLLKYSSLDVKQQSINQFLNVPADWVHPTEQFIAQFIPDLSMYFSCKKEANGIGHNLLQH